MLLGKCKEFGMVRDWVLVLYGTAFPPQKNDSLTLQTTIKNKNGDVKINKKSKNQNQDAFIKQRKNGRDKKNDNLKTSTTHLPPAYSTGVDSLGEEYSKAPKFKKLNTNRYQVITTSRPRVTVKLPTLKSQNENVNNLYLKKTSKILSTYQPNNNNKLAGKLAKQVNNNLFSTESTVIPKKFGNYEKIEQFYPELRPVNEFNNPAFFTIATGIKTEHENSKSTSMVPTNYFSQSIIGEGNESTSTQRVKEQQLKKMPKGTNICLYKIYDLIRFLSLLFFVLPVVFLI